MAMDIDNPLQSRAGNWEGSAVSPGRPEHVTAVIDAITEALDKLGDDLQPGEVIAALLIQACVGATMGGITEEQMQRHLRESYRTAVAMVGREVIREAADREARKP